MSTHDILLLFWPRFIILSRRLVSWTLGINGLSQCVFLVFYILRVRSGFHSCRCFGLSPLSFSSRLGLEMSNMPLCNPGRYACKKEETGPFQTSYLSCEPVLACSLLCDQSRRHLRRIRLSDVPCHIICLASSSITLALLVTMVKGRKQIL